MPGLACMNWLTGLFGTCTAISPARWLSRMLVILSDAISETGAPVISAAAAARTSDPRSMSRYTLSMVLDRPDERMKGSTMSSSARSCPTLPSHNGQISGIPSVGFQGNLPLHEGQRRLYPISVAPLGALRLYSQPQPFPNQPEF